MPGGGGWARLELTDALSLATSIPKWAFKLLPREVLEARSLTSFKLAALYRQLDLCLVCPIDEN